MFKLAEELKIKLIKLSAVIDGPIDVVSKYKEKGFKEIGMDDEYVKMSCNKYEIKEQLKSCPLIYNIKLLILKTKSGRFNNLIVDNHLHPGVKINQKHSLNQNLPVDIHYPAR